MFAIVTSAQGAPEKQEEGIAVLRESAQAAQGTVPGFRGLYALIDRATGKHLVVSLWETREDAEAAGELAERMWEPVVEVFGITGAPIHEVYEVALQG